MTVTTLDHDVRVVEDDIARDAGGQEYGHLTVLLAEFAELDASDPRRVELRAELVAGYLPVVQNIARRYRNRGEPLCDLEQAGAIGLLNALERYDPDRGVDFLGYLVPTVTGELRRHFRDRTWAMRVPRRLKDLQGPIRQAVASLSTTLGRAPKPSEIAARLDAPLGDVIDALGAQQAYAADSLDALVGGTDIALGDLLGRVDESLQTMEYRQSLRTALAELPDRERTILILRFFGDLTQTQIAEQVGLSQMHVSRLLAQTLAGLRDRLEAQ